MTTLDMRRGTNSAILFGKLLRVVREAGIGLAMRPIGEAVGGVAATVSKVEKGERALKANKIRAWSAALEVDEDDLLELWLLCQGRVPTDGKPAIYTDRDGPLWAEPLDEIPADVLEREPEVVALHRLTARIMTVLGRLLPAAHFSWGKYEPRYMNQDGTWNSPEEEDADHEAAPLPIIDCYWDDPKRGKQLASITVPILDDKDPANRRPGTSITGTELTELIDSLSAAERDRVHGYIEAVIEGRPVGPG